MRNYEIMMILSPEIDERTIQNQVDDLLAVVPESKGTIDNIDFWGRRRLAYEIQKHQEAIYVVVDFTADSATAAELDRQLRLNESVLRTKVMRKDS